MANLKEIRIRIKSVTNTQQVTKAMKMVSAAKLRKAQDSIIQMRPYAAKLQEIIQHVTASVNPDDISSNLLNVRPVEKVLVILVTSTRGLCGPFNTILIKRLDEHLEANFSKEMAAGNVDFLCAGGKGYDHYKKRGHTVLGKRDTYNIQADLRFERAAEAMDEVFELYENGDYDKVLIVYNEFKNVMAQNRMIESFLPVSVEQDEEEAEGHISDYIYQPNQEEILSELIPKTLKIRFYRAILESNAAEQGARMVAMDKATENAEDMLKKLKLTYNKARQAAITKEILEIAAGADALGG